MAVIVAGPLIEILYTAKWADSVPYFQLLCIAGAILPVNMANLNIIKSQGKGLMYMFMQISQFVIGISAMLMGSRWGVAGLICGGIATSYLYTLIVIQINTKILGKSIMRQYVAIFKNMIIAGMVAAVTILIFHDVNIGVFLSLIVPAVVYIIIYIVVSYLLRISGFNMCLRVIGLHK